MINFKKYNSFIFDFDGVILDSNNIKKIAIGKAVQGVLSSQKAREFVDYFVSLNGIPREVKIEKYVPKGQFLQVLSKYEKILDKKLKDGYTYPKIHCVKYRFSDELYEKDTIYFISTFKFDRKLKNAIIIKVTNINPSISVLSLK